MVETVPEALSCVLQTPVKETSPGLRNHVCPALTSPRGAREKRNPSPVGERTAPETALPSPRSAREKRNPEPVGEQTVPERALPSPRSAREKRNPEPVGERTATEPLSSAAQGSRSEVSGALPETPGDVLRLKLPHEATSPIESVGEAQNKAHRSSFFKPPLELQLKPTDADPQSLSIRGQPGSSPVLSPGLRNEANETSAEPHRNPHGTSTGAPPVLSPRRLQIESNGISAEPQRNLTGTPAGVPPVLSPRAFTSPRRKSVPRAKQPGEIVVVNWDAMVKEGTVRLVRALQSTAPVLAVTAHLKDGAREEALQAGCAEVLGWPLRELPVVTAVQKALGMEVVGKRRQAVVARYLEGRKALVVDDNQINRKLAGRILEGEGCKVVFAASGAEALERVREAHVAGEEFDIVLMDLQVGRVIALFWISS